MDAPPAVEDCAPFARIAALMQDAGLQDVRLEWVNEMSWAAIGTKPAGR